MEENILRWATGFGMGGAVSAIITWLLNRRGSEAQRLLEQIKVLQAECERRAKNEDKWSECAEKLKQLSAKQSLELYLCRKERKGHHDELKEVTTLLADVRGLLEDLSDYIEHDDCEKKNEQALEIVQRVIAELEQDVEVPPME